jgi:anion-transporting  ArsA/GET3 family ATPase
MARAVYRSAQAALPLPDAACYTGDPLPSGLSHIFGQKRTVICVGSGGVGKTTTAAAIALEGSRRGLRALVLTIDPARRLASSLGLGQIGHDVQAIPDDVLATAGGKVAEGRLYAMMLDQKRAFDEVVSRYASDPEAVKRILANPIYAQISGSLAGAQEYAALAKLEEFERDDEYQLIVVDTPPTAHALDFLDAPQKLSAAIDSPAIEWFRRLRGQSGSGWSMVGRTGAYVLKRLSKFVGTRFLDDLALFFTEFNDILGGFRQRAEATFALLRRPQVGFVLVASPEPMAMREALSFHERLVTSGMPMSGFVVNRVHPSRPLSGPPDAAAIAGQLASHPPVADLALQPGTLRIAAESLLAAHADLEVLAVADRSATDRFRTAAGPTGSVTEIPLFDEDVHDLTRLRTLGQYLFP